MTRVPDAEVEAAAAAMAAAGGASYERLAAVALEAAAHVREEARQERANAAAKRYADATRDLPDVPDEPMPKRKPPLQGETIRAREARLARIGYGRHGGSAGDHMLKLAQALAVGRGDEVYQPTSLRGINIYTHPTKPSVPLSTIAELRASLKAKRKHQDEHADACTESVGLAYCNGAMDTLDAAIARIDAALPQLKEQSE